MTLLKRIFFKIFKKQISLSQLNSAKNKQNLPIRLVIGSGHTLYKGWLISDIDTLNITLEADWNKYFKVASITSVLAEHVFEHLSESDRDKSFQNIYRYLKQGGNFRIAVPDGFHSDKQYVEYVKPGGHGPGSDDHKFLYNYNTLSEALRKVGFTIRLLEYFDEQGNLHMNQWDSKDGMVMRSVINDKRNRDGCINYSSLLIDAIK